MMKANQNLTKAKAAKQDEFYTQLTDIEKELKHYTKHFKGKVVFCNCDDPKVSNFYRYFYLKFEELGLKRLIATCYKNDDPNSRSRGISKKAKYLDWDGKGEPKIVNLEGNGDFRSEECIALLKQADIVVTNPPFSLFRDYVAQLVDYGKKFLIVGSMNAITYKEVFKLIKDGKLWQGYKNGDMAFKVPDYYEARETRYWKDERGQKWRSLGNTCWFTNLDHKKRHEDLILYKTYNKKEYPKYDNYDAINVDKTKDIPIDYEGVMGVPITFLDKFNPNQFEIIGQMVTTKVDEFNYGYPYVKGKKIYARILIKRR
jgi:hypothetical protein